MSRVVLAGRACEVRLDVLEARHRAPVVEGVLQVRQDEHEVTRRSRGSRLHSESARNGFAMCSSVWERETTSYDASSIPSKDVASRMNRRPGGRSSSYMNSSPSAAAPCQIVCRRSRNCRVRRTGDRAAEPRCARRSQEGHRSRSRDGRRQAAGRSHTPEDASEFGSARQAAPSPGGRSTRVGSADDGPASPHPSRSGDLPTTVPSTVR